MKKKLPSNVGTKEYLRSLPTLYLLTSSSERYYVDNYPNSCECNEEGVPLVWVLKADEKKEEYVITSIFDACSNRVCLWGTSSNDIHILCNYLNSAKEYIDRKLKE